MSALATREVWPAVIGGERVLAGGRMSDTDPATGEVLAEVFVGGLADVDRAVDAAHDAFRTWRRTSPAARAALMRALSERIRESLDELARIESLDTGKPLREAKADTTVCARYYEFYANTVEALTGEVLVSRPDLFGYTLRQPIGVTAHITSWNYPLQIGARTLAPALAAGNCVILKPSSEAPLSSIRIAELALDVGFPPGVLNVLPGPGDVVGLGLAAHPWVGMVAFTGSLEVGQLVAKAAADNVVPVTLELGGKSPNVVFADADLERAVPVIQNSILQNAGQSCVAGSRLLVHRSVQEPLVAALEARFRAVGLGHGIDDPDMGPLISQRQLDRVVGFVSEARATASLRVGGGQPEEERLGSGNFFMPTIFEDVDPDSRLAQEEVFGPVLAVTAFDDDDEAIELANRSAYGLAAAVWTRDVGRAHAVAREIDAGTVHINGFGVGGGVEMPSGGFKRSGYGREKGFEAMLEFTQHKSVMVRP